MQTGFCDFGAKFKGAKTQEIVGLGKVAETVAVMGQLVLGPGQWPPTEWCIRSATR